jgi:hypothetical protein
LLIIVDKKYCLSITLEKGFERSIILYINSAYGLKTKRHYGFIGKSSRKTNIALWANLCPSLNFQDIRGEVKV